MSNLQKSFAKSRVERHVPLAVAFDEVEEERFQGNDDDNHDNAVAEHHELSSENNTTRVNADVPDDASYSSSGTIRPSSSVTKSLFSHRRSRYVPTHALVYQGFFPHSGLIPSLSWLTPSIQSRAAWECLPWSNFFERELFLDDDYDDEDINGAIHVTHHVYLTPPKPGGPLFVMHHGAGSSGLSFAAVTAEIKKTLPEAGVLSLDTREHGETTVRRKISTGNEASNDTTNGAAVDMRLGTLSQDLVAVVRLTQDRMQWTELPDIVLVGHSLGGAVVTDVAKKGELGAKVLAYAVLDVVEGSAIEALQSMEAYLAARPSSFPSLASAIEWHIRSRTIRNATSACVTVPSLLREDKNPDHSTPADPRPWTWRTDLRATQSFWENWFRGLSKKFLEGKGGKLLLLAGTDRLDKELMIGQMQGKYQLQIFPEAGHFLHEDQPAKTANILIDFFRRNDRTALVLPPKIGPDSTALKAMHQSRGSVNNR